MIAAVKSIINKHGTERTNWVLANSILVNTDDERISKSNKEWAKAFPIPQESSNWDYSIQTHPSLINSFAIGMREVCSEIHNAQKQEKPSILGQVKDNAAAISTAEKKETPNKQNGLEV